MQSPLQTQFGRFTQFFVYYGGHFLCIIASFAFLYTSFNYLQLSIAYAVWIGIGTAGAVDNRVVFDHFGEAVLEV